ncbi:MAG: EamA family transporter [Bacteroidota bacterium]
MKVSRGVVYMLIASFVFTLMKVFVKLIPHIPAVEVILFRSIISFVISIYFLKRQKVSVWGNNKKVLFGRGLAGAIALVTYFSLLQQIPLATASTLQYLSPIFTTVIGIFLVGEKVKPMQFVFFGLSFAGILVIQGFDPRISWIHLLMGVFASFFMGLAYNFIRKLKKSEHPLVIIFYFPLVMLPVSAVWSAFIWVQPTGLDWLMLLAVGICTQVAQFFMTKSYQEEELNKVSILSYISIIYSLSFGYFIFDETYDWIIYGGMALVLFGVILNVVWKKREA